MRATILAGALGWILWANLDVPEVPWAPLAVTDTAETCAARRAEMVAVVTEQRGQCVDPRTLPLVCAPDTVRPPTVPETVKLRQDGRKPD